MSYDLSIIVLSYNSDFEKLINTIASVMMQRNVKIQLIISDDCSDDNHFEKLHFLFSALDYDCYVLLESNVNTGQVGSIKRALQFAKGKYVKYLAPGDYLYSINTASIMISSLERNNASLCFGHAIYYRHHNDLRI